MQPTRRSARPKPLRLAWGAVSVEVHRQRACICAPPANEPAAQWCTIWRALRVLCARRVLYVACSEPAGKKSRAACARPRVRERRSRFSWRKGAKRRKALSQTAGPLDAQSLTAESASRPSAPGTRPHKIAGRSWLHMRA